MNIYTNLFEATSRNIQQDKILFYCQQQKYEKREKVIQDIEAELIVHGLKINQMKVNESVRTLGVHMYLSLSQKSQFKAIRKKQQIPIMKLMSTDINPYQAVVYYNVHMIKSVYFRCRVVKLTTSQEYELKKLYEKLLLKNQVEVKISCVIYYIAERLYLAQE